MQQVAIMGSEVRYSGRTGKRPDIIKPSAQPTIAASPVWPLAAVVFVSAFLLHDLAFAVAVVIAQLAAMTALQWLVLWAQRKAANGGLPLFKGVPILKVVRIGAFWAALAYSLIS